MGDDDGRFASLQRSNPIESIKSKTGLAAELHRLLFVRERATGKSLKRAALARMIGVSESSLYAYLSGTTLPSADVFDRLLDALDVSPLERQQLSSARDNVDVQVRLRRLSTARPVPRQLPAAPRLFTGRSRELLTLTQVLRNDADRAVTVMISAIGGVGGIGKTWLALHWAHQNLDLFPDGQLFVNLRGFDPTGQPMPVETALRGFLDALGVESGAIPAGLDAQATLYRSLVASKRMLIVLDNAHDRAQIAPLLPGGRSCAVLVTSRRRMDSLIAADGAHLLDLDVLPDAESRELLARHLGTDRVAAEPNAVTELLGYCGGLPLAISITAARATRHPHFPLAAATEELRDHSGRLDAMATSDTAMSPRAVFSWSYHALTLPAASLFSMLGLTSGPDIGLPATANLNALSIAPMTVLVRELEAAHLIQQPAPRRYRMHDLVRLYAIETHHDLPASRLEAALRRLVDFYVHTAYAGDRLLNPNRPPIATGPPSTPFHRQSLNTETSALKWLNLEYPNLLAIHHLVIDRGWHTHTYQLAWALDTFQWRRGHRQNLLVAWRAGRTAADDLCDPTIQTQAYRLLGRACVLTGKHNEAFAHLRHALDLAEITNDTLGQAYAHEAFVTAWEQNDDDRRALTHATQALRLYQTLDNPVRIARALNSVGWFHARLEQHEQAHRCCGQALTLHRRYRDRHGEAATLDSLGLIAYETGQYLQALDYYKQSLTLFHDTGSAYYEPGTLDRLGQTYAALGQQRQARTAWQRAVELYEAQHRTAEVDRIKRRLAADH